MNKYLKESILWVFIVLPYLYLLTIWNNLPELVPIHFNMNGEANDWSSKTMLLFIPGALGIGIYILMLIIPFIDPKKKIQQMGDKYFSFRLMLTIFISLISIYSLNASSAGSLKNQTIFYALIGAFFAILGNYFQAVRPNYFIGIRTPWTLENELVWKKTHRLGGRLWMASGIILVLLAFFIKNNMTMYIVFGVLVIIMIIVPVVYSYIEFQKEKSIVRK